MLKKLTLGLLVLALAASCSHFKKPDSATSGRCFNMYFAAREVAGIKNDSKMLSELTKYDWCVGDAYKVKADACRLKEYIDASKD